MTKYVIDIANGTQSTTLTSANIGRYAAIVEKADSKLFKVTKRNKRLRVRRKRLRVKNKRLRLKNKRLKAKIARMERLTKGVAKRSNKSRL